MTTSVLDTLVTSLYTTATQLFHIMFTITKAVITQLTAMYDRVPTNVLTKDSIELRSRPLTPKSQSFISPAELTKMFDGFTSASHNISNQRKCTADCK